jgi:hypothetical protein
LHNLQFKCNYYFNQINFIKIYSQTKVNIIFNLANESPTESSEIIKIGSNFRNISPYSSVIENYQKERVKNNNNLNQKENLINYNNSKSKMYKNHKNRTKLLDKKLEFHLKSNSNSHNLSNLTYRANFQQQHIKNEKDQIEKTNNISIENKNIYENSCHQIMMHPFLLAFNLMFIFISNKVI